jgi:hypothetical protein
LVPLSKTGKSNWAQKPDTVARLHKVTNALLKQAGRAHEIKSLSTTAASVKAGQILTYIPKSRRPDFTTQHQIRGLAVLVTSGDVDRIPEAIEIAMEAAGDRGKKVPSREEVTKAARLVKVAADKARREGASAGKASDAYTIDRTRTKRLKAEDAVSVFLDAAQKDGANGQQQIKEFTAFLKAKWAARKK